MTIKCICINCEFYLSCWINTAFKNFPKSHNKLKQKKKTYKLLQKTDFLSYLPAFLYIQLNINKKNYILEPDIIFCDSFMEKPGNWLL